MVNDSLKITRKDIVKIYCNKHTIDLAENLAVECQRAGAHANVSLYTDKIQHDIMLDRPIEYLETPDPFELATLDVANISIDLSSTEDPSKYEQITPERMNAMRKGNEAYMEKLYKTKHQGTTVRLAMVTPVRAKVYGIDYEAWRKNTYASVDVDYKEIQELGTKFRKTLEKAKEMQISNAAGTDLKARFETANIRIDDGVLDRKGSEKVSNEVELPGGSVSAIPVISSVQGTFVSDTSLPMRAKLVEGITWKFDKGNVVSFEGRKNIDLVKDIWLKATGDKDKFGFIRFGLNPKMKPGFMFDIIVRGAVTVGIGDNRWFGGTNESTTTSYATTIAASVKIDGKTIINKGKVLL